MISIDFKQPTIMSLNYFYVSLSISIRSLYELYKILDEIIKFYDYYIFTGQDIIPLIPLEC